MRRATLFVLIFFSIISITPGQTILEIDELNRRAESFVNQNVDSAIALAGEAVKLSEQINYYPGKSVALSHMGFSYYIKGQYDKAIKYSTDGIEIGEAHNVSYGLERAYHALGLVYINQNKSEEAIRIFTVLVEMANNSRNMNTLADALSNLGLAYLNKKYYQRAREFLSASLQVYKNIEHPHGEVFSNLNYGRIFFEQNEYDSAIYYMDQASVIAKEIDGERALLHINSIKGQIYLSSNNLPEAESSFVTAYQIASTHHLIWEEANLTSWLCETYYEKGEFEKSIDYGKIAVSKAREAKIIYIIQRVNTIMAKAYMDSDDYAAAENHVKYMEFLIDSLTLSDLSNPANSIIDKKISEEEEKNLQLVSNQLAAARAQISTRNISLAAVTISSLLLAAVLLLIVRSNRIKTKTNRELIELNRKMSAQKTRLQNTVKQLDATNKEKDLLVGMVAHDIRSPLNKISGLVNILKLENGMDAGQQQVFDMVQKTIKDANKLASELLEINKIESGAIEQTNDPIDLSEFINQTTDQFKPIAEEKGIEIKQEIEFGGAKVTTDRKLLQRIFENLLSNAIKFSDVNSEVNIQLTKEDERVKLNVIDHGIGIPQEEHKLLFTKFGKTSARPTGGEPSNGLGLYIVNELTQTIGGELTFESKTGEGSQFAIILPIVS